MSAGKEQHEHQYQGQAAGAGGRTSRQQWETGEGGSLIQSELREGLRAARSTKAHETTPTTTPISKMMLVMKSVRGATGSHYSRRSRHDRDPVAIGPGADFITVVELWALSRISGCLQTYRKSMQPYGKSMRPYGKSMLAILS